jgi:Kef-type K+ transport system membrane component KefB
VGISARVLKDLGQVKSQEGRTILGAAIVDDVLGLVILAVVVALIGSSGSTGVTSGQTITQTVLIIISKAFGFLVVGTLLGLLLSKRVYRWAAGLEMRGMLLTLSLTLCFAFAYLSHKFGGRFSSVSSFQQPP